MLNFPQSFEPVNSDSILEEFLKLKRRFFTFEETVNTLEANTLSMEYDENEKSLIFNKGE